MTSNSSQHVALVTGSGKRVGCATVLELARRGCNVVINGSRDSGACERVAQQARALGVEALVVMGNVGERAGAHAIAEQALSAFGYVDILVNNAAVRPTVDFLAIDEEEWDRIFNIDFKAGFWLSRSLLPGMVGRGWGRIINFTGRNAQEGYQGKSPVAVAKHAAVGLTKSLAREYGPSGITTNIISPGKIIDDDTDVQADPVLMARLAKSPAGRLGLPDDIATSVAFLASEEAGFINGQMLQVNGGEVC
jgi:3-oxoacyl-[acyl-carrier protein] reductase